MVNINPSEIIKYSPADFLYSAMDIIRFPLYPNKNKNITNFSEYIKNRILLNSSSDHFYILSLFVSELLWDLKETFPG